MSRMAGRSGDSRQHNTTTTQEHSRWQGISAPASRTGAAAVETAAPPATVRRRTAEAAGAFVSGGTPSVAAAEPPSSSNNLEKKIVAAGASSVPLPETMDLRDRLFAGISETSVDEGDDDGAEVVIEPDGRIKVHPRRKPGYLRYGGALEPSALGANIEAGRSAVEREARAAKDLLLLRLLRTSRQSRSGSGSVLDSFLEEEIGKLLIDEVKADAAGLHSLAELEAESRTEPDSSSTSETYAKSRVLTSPAGYFVAFIVGFGGILLIAMLCCVIRAAYVKRQKALLKKLLSEKLGDAAVEEPEGADLTTPVLYEVIDSQEQAVLPSECDTAETEWIDVRVDQQAPPEEQQLMNVARLDTISKTGETAEVTEEEGTKQVPYKSKKERQKGVVVSLWKDEKLDQRDTREKRKYPKKSDRVSRSGSTGTEKEGEKKRKTRRGKDLKKVLSSKRTLRKIG